MPLALPAWLMPSVPAGKPRTRQAQHPRQQPQAAKKRKISADSDAHTGLANKHQLGGNTDTHTDPVKKQKLAGNTGAHTDPPVQRLQAMPPKDDTPRDDTPRDRTPRDGTPRDGIPRLQTSHTKDGIAQTEQGLFWSSPPKATASTGAVAVLGISSLQQQLFPAVERAQHNKRGLAKKSRNQIDSGSPQKRVQMYESIRASQRCGYCKTCLNRSMKKACLTRRSEMDTAKIAVNVA